MLLALLWVVLVGFYLAWESVIVLLSPMLVSWRLVEFCFRAFHSPRICLWHQLFSPPFSALKTEKLFTYQQGWDSYTVLMPHPQEENLE